MKPLELYQENLNICLADTPALKERVFNVRYQVYGKEIGYNLKKEGEPEVEMDEYDNYAKHCLLIHKPSGRAIGCARLIVPHPRRPELPLPFERDWIDTIDRSLFDPDLFLPGQVVEFSRIAVIEEYRRSRGHRRKTDSDYISIIPLCLFLACLSMLIASDADYGFAMMEAKLVRLLRRIGFVFEPVGEAVYHFGWRAPYIIHRDNALRYLTKRDTGDLFREIDRAMQVREVEQLITAV